MIRLLQNFYFDSSSERQKEINECFYRNSSLSEIDHFVPFVSSDRVSFSSFINIINKLTSENDINIIANSDIYFDSTIKLAKKIQSNECYALSRWEVKSNQTIEHFARPDSQDVWIFRGSIKNISADFFLGYRGCDNRFAYEAQKSGYQILNPSLSIKTYHLHITNVRNYTFENNFLIPGPYLQVQISSL